MKPRGHPDRPVDLIIVALAIVAFLAAISVAIYFAAA